MVEKASWAEGARREEKEKEKSSEKKKTEMEKMKKRTMVFGVDCVGVVYGESVRSGEYRRDVWLWNEAWWGRSKPFLWPPASFLSFCVLFCFFFFFRF